MYVTFYLLEGWLSDQSFSRSSHENFPWSKYEKRNKGTKIMKFIHGDIEDSGFKEKLRMCK